MSKYSVVCWAEWTSGVQTGQRMWGEEWDKRRKKVTGWDVGKFWGIGKLWGVGKF